MKKFMMMAVMAVAALTASAQKGEFHVTPHVSLGYTHLSDAKGTTMFGTADFSHNLTGAVGAEVEYMVSNSIGLSAGLDYTYTRSSKDMYKVDGVEIDSYCTYSFFNVPVLVQYHFGEGFAIKAGVQPMFLLDADMHVDGKDKSTSVSKKGSLKDNCESAMLAIPVGISYTFQDTPITVDLRCNIPATKLNQDEIVDQKMLGIIATVGYRF